MSAYALSAHAQAGKEWAQFGDLQKIRERLLGLAEETRTDAVTYETSGIVLLAEMFPANAAQATATDWPFVDINLASISKRNYERGQLAILGEQARSVSQAVGTVGRFFRLNGEYFYVDYRPLLPYEENFPEFEPPTQ